MRRTRIGFILAMALVWACSQSIESNRTNELKEPAMSIEANPHGTVQPLPPIDAQIPPVIETAAFGLG